MTLTLCAVVGNLAPFGFSEEQGTAIYHVLQAAHVAARASSWGVDENGYVQVTDEGLQGIEIFKGLQRIERLAIARLFATRCDAAGCQQLLLSSSPNADSLCTVQLGLNVPWH